MAAAQIPTALGRSASLNSTVITERTSGIMKPALSPSTVRAAMNSPGPVAKAQASELSPNTARVIIMTFLRPNRSPSSPPGSSPTASPSVYEDTNHCRSVAEACRETARVGSATLSTVASSPTASTPSVNPASAHHFRAPALRAPIMLMTLTTIQ